MKTMPFQNKVALVTGSSRGIGRAIALKFAEMGSDVMINYRNPRGSSGEKSRQLCGEIRNMGRRAHVVQCDISQKAAVRKLVQETGDRFGRLDFLILNAARAPFKPFERLLERDLRQLVDTNYLGHIFCIQEAVRLLEKTAGKIVFISSLGGRFHQPAYPLGSLKAAMEVVVRDCAESLRDRNISVNGVCGGLVRTDSLKVLRMHMEPLERVPAHLLMAPEEIADVVLFLCTPEARGISGQTLIADRGLSNRLY